jgi:TonB-linked SusC/RagA family outer membrane protein
MKEPFIYSKIGFKRKWLVYLMTLFLMNNVSFLNAQEAIQVSGVVTDESGGFLPGVNVVLKGTVTGAVTDTEGRYSLSGVSPDGWLVFSFIGFENVEVEVSGRSSIHVVLKESGMSLNEVVVIGYGSMNKRELSSSIVNVNREDFLQGAVNNPMELVAGKVAGMNVVTTAAANPNQGTSVQVRGATSLIASNNPLIVIDGIPGGDLRNISPQDIESITVLKDGASSAIYGTRGANGVILVTTRKGSGVAGTVNVTYDSWFGINLANNKPDILSPDEFRRSRRGHDYGGSTDWYAELLRDFSYDNNQYLSVDGRTETGHYAASFNYKEATGLDIANERKEIGGRFSITQRAIDELVEFSGSLNGRKVNEIWGDNGQFDNAITINPTMPIFNEDGSYYHPTSPTGARNPVEELTSRVRGGDRIYLLANSGVKVSLIKSAVHNLTTGVTYSLQYNDLNQHDFVPSTTAESEQEGYRGRATLQYQKWQNQIFEWLTSYDFENNGHNIKAIAGYSYQDFTWESRWMENNDFSYDNFLWHNMQSGSFLGEGRAGMTSGKSLSKLIGFFGRLNYNFKDVVFTSASLRHEGSTKFGYENKWGYFPAASVAVELTNTGFINNSNVNSLKLRASYGVTGRSDFDAYRSISTYSSGGQYYMDGAWVSGYGPGINPNPELKWEKGVNTNIGVDFMFWNRLSGSVEVFDRSSNDLLYTYQAPQPPMIYNTILVNVGTISNRGLEISLNGDVIRGGDFSWHSAINYSYGTTELETLSNEIYHASYLELYQKPGVGTSEFLFRVEEGQKIGQFYGYEHAGISTNGDLLIYNKDGEMIPKGSETLEDKRFIGNGVPSSFLSFNNTLKYRNFDLGIYLRGAFGFDIMNYRRYGMGLKMSGTANVLREAYTEYADVTKDGAFLSSFFLEKGDYLKVENVTLGYTLPMRNHLENRFISRIRAFASAKNIYTLTDYTGNDPSIVQVNGLEPGVDTGSAYPTALQLSMGLTINFK